MARGLARMYSRREACCAAAGAFAAAALCGCSNGSGGAENGFDPVTHARKGYAADTQVKDYPVNIRLYADANVQWVRDAVTGEGSHLDGYIARYRELKDRAQVTFDVTYIDLEELLELVAAGMPDCDALLAPRFVVEAGNAAGTVDGGAGGYMIRSLLSQFSEHCVLVRAAGSETSLPDAPTLTGEDTPDGKINRFQQIASVDGYIAMTDPLTTMEGIMATNEFRKAGFYDEGQDGTVVLDEALSEKLVLYPSQEAAMDAVGKGECKLGFAMRSMIGYRYDQVEFLYDPQGSIVEYAGAAVTGSPEPEVARDFFAYMLENI